MITKGLYTQSLVLHGSFKEYSSTIKSCNEPLAGAFILKPAWANSFLVSHFSRRHFQMHFCKPFEGYSTYLGFLLIIRYATPAIIIIATIQPTPMPATAPLGKDSPLLLAPETEI